MALVENKSHILPSFTWIFQTRKKSAFCLLVGFWGGEKAKQITYLEDIGRFRFFSLATFASKFPYHSAVVFGWHTPPSPSHKQVAPTGLLHRYPRSRVCLPKTCITMP